MLIVSIYLFLASRVETYFCDCTTNVGKMADCICSIYAKLLAYFKLVTYPMNEGIVAVVRLGCTFSNRRVQTSQQDTEVV